jgi:hypothetical protein
MKQRLEPPTGGGFGAPPPRRTIGIWFASYHRDNEHEPLAVSREPIACAPGQDLAHQAVRHARGILATRPEVFEVLAHRGPYATPAAGDDVLARVCREAFPRARRLG